MKQTSLALLVALICLGPVRGQAPSAADTRATVAYLQALQNDDGGFAPSKAAVGEKAASSLRATSAALRALKYFGGEAKDRPACARYVRHCFDSTSGGFADTPGGKPDVTVTAVGIMAVVELKLPAEDYSASVVRYLGEHARTFEETRIAAAGLEAITTRPRQADKWLQDLYRMRSPDGTFGKGDGAARDTGGAVVAVLRLGGQVKNREAVVNVMKGGQRPDGGWGKAGASGSDLETSYRVMRAFSMLSEKPDTGRCQRFIARCRNQDGGYGVAPGQPSSASGTYFASIILHWLEEK